MKRNKLLQSISLLFTFHVFSRKITITQQNPFFILTKSVTDTISQSDRPFRMSDFPRQIYVGSKSCLVCCGKQQTRHVA